VDRWPNLIRVKVDEDGDGVCGRDSECVTNVPLAYADILLVDPK
jgi:hypothetical protein